MVGLGLTARSGYVRHVTSGCVASAEVWPTDQTSCPEVGPTAGED